MLPHALFKSDKWVFFWGFFAFQCFVGGTSPVCSHQSQWCLCRCFPSVVKGTTPSSYWLCIVTTQWNKIKQPQMQKFFFWVSHKVYPCKVHTQHFIDGPLKMYVHCCSARINIQCVNLQCARKGHVPLLSSPDLSMPVSLNLLCTQLMARPGPPDVDAEIEDKEYPLDPLASFKLYTMYIANLHCDSLSGRVAQHDVTDT